MRQQNWKLWRSQPLGVVSFFFFLRFTLATKVFLIHLGVSNLWQKSNSLMELRLYSLPHSCRKLRTSASFDDWTKNLLSLCLHLRSFRYFKKYFLKNSLVFTLSLGNFLRFFPFSLLFLCSQVYSSYEPNCSTRLVWSPSLALHHSFLY